MGSGGSFYWAKAAGHETDHSPAPNAKVKNVWSCTSTTLYVIMAQWLTEHRNVFIM